MDNRRSVERVADVIGGDEGRERVHLHRLFGLRLDAAEKQIRERDAQIERHREHLARLQTKIATIELLVKGGMP